MYRKNIRLLSYFNFLIGLGFFAPLAIVYFSRIAGSYTLGASIFGITMLASSFFEVPTGIWSDKVGRRKTIILGSWARLAAFIAYAVGLSYGWLVVGAVLEGLSRSFYSGNNDAFLHDTLSDSQLESEYDEHLGKVSSTEQFALGLSAAVGSIIASVSFPVLLWLTVASQLGLVGISYLFIDPKSRSHTEQNVYAHLKEAFALFIKNKKLRLLSIASIFNFAFTEMLYQFRAAFISTVWPLWAVGFANTLANFGATWSFYYSGKLIKRYKASNILLFKNIWGRVMSIISYGIPSVFSPLLTATGSLMYGVGNVAENSLMQKEFSESQRATMSSLNAFAGSIMFFIVSLVLGAAADLWGPARGPLVLVILSCPVVYIYWVLFKGENGKK